MEALFILKLIIVYIVNALRQFICFNLFSLWDFFLASFIISSGITVWHWFISARRGGTKV